MTEESILRLPEVLKRTGLCRTSLYTQRATGDFPRAIRLGPRAVGWMRSEVDAWIAQRAESRGAGTRAVA